MTLRTRLGEWKRAAVDEIAALRWGSQSGIVDLAQLRREHPERWHRAFGPMPASRGHARAFGEEARFTLDPAPLPELGVIELPGGSARGIEGWVHDADGRIVADASWWGSRDAVPQRPRSFLPPLRLEGTCLTLASDFGSANYGHFVLDCLPRWALFLAAGFTADDVDHILLPPPPSPTARALIASLDIPLGKCRFEDRQIRADMLLATSFPGRRRDFPAFTPQFLQGASGRVERRTRRLYLPRQGRRQVSNESELIAIAARYGFEVHDHRHCADEPRTFAEAAAVVSPSGASLANLAFCAPGSHVLELIPSDHVRSYWVTLSHAARLNYSYLVGPSARFRGPDAWGPSFSDFTVDPAAFERAIATIDAEISDR